MIDTKVLEACGFVHEEFPDGWFWHINPAPDSREAKIIGKALGFSETDADEWTDTIIFQMSDEGIWSYVFGGDVGQLASEEAESILSQMMNLSNCPYCEGDEALFHNAEHDISAFIDYHGNLMVSAGDNSVEFPVEFCPKCGRKFVESGENTALEGLLSLCSYERLLELAQADKEGRCVILHEKEPLTKGMRVWYADKDTGEIEEGEVFSAYYKDDKLDSFSVNFILSGDFDEFIGSAWGSCFFGSPEEAKAALMKGKNAHEKAD